MLLQIRNLSVTFPAAEGAFRALSGIDLDVDDKDTLAVVGESGCGKSVLAYAILGLLDEMAAVSGSVRLMGMDITSAGQSELQGIRGKLAALVPQSPSLAFNPVITIGEQIRECVERSGILRGRAAVHKTLGLISDVGFPDPAAIYGAFPHRLSGGMCEMALIAMALAQAPKLLVADEPTKWLDAIAAKTVLRVLHEAAAQAGLLMITHDLGAASSCNRMAVMYAGEIVEEGFTREVLDFPLHFYTGGLLQARPSRGMKPLRSAGLHLVDGEWGCRFRNRCDGADEKCEVHPRLRERMGRRKVRCHHA